MTKLPAQNAAIFMPSEAGRTSRTMKHSAASPTPITPIAIREETYEWPNDSNQENVGTDAQKDLD